MEKKLDTKIQAQWYSLNSEKVLQKLDTELSGLKQEGAETRLRNYGANTLPESITDSSFTILLRQFKSPLIYLLLFACVILGLLGAWKDTITIFAVLFLNAVVGAFQEGKAQNTLLALKRLLLTQATVLRDGNEITIPDAEVVPGDILILREGEKVVADARVLESASLSVNEAALTGESLPVRKITAPISDDKPKEVFEQKNMVFKGTDVVLGSGLAVVTSTGVETEIGKITLEVSGAQTEMPLNKQIAHLSNVILVVVGAFSIGLFVLGIMLRQNILEMFFTVVALAVSLIPEGLPVVITLVLATGVWRMSKRNALVRKLAAVESLGQATVVAVDKTGTLTRNELQVEKVYVDNKIYEVKGKGYEPTGELIQHGERVPTLEHPILSNAATIAALCNKTSIKHEVETDTWKVLGDPTEAALIVFAQRLGVVKDQVLLHKKLVAEIPFDYNRKYRAVVYNALGQDTMYVLGAPEVILNHSELSESEKIALLNKAEGLAREGYRVLAGAYKPKLKEIKDDQLPTLNFVCIYALSDSLHDEVNDTVMTLKNAGIKVVMLTGDNKLTAETIGKKTGIYTEGNTILTGKELEEFNEKDLLRKLITTTIFARVTPEHKLKLIQLYRKLGHIVAMTGDGVNDAPALVKADLGVAMGVSGTSVAKEAGDIILLDDKLGSIAAAVEEGRNIYQTIRKVILYLFSTNIGEAFTITAAIILSMPLPVLPTQIIWLNFVTDGFLTLALGLERKESGLLSRRPRKNDQLIDKKMLSQVIVMSTPMVIGTLMVFSWYLNNDSVKALTMSMTTLAIFQWFNAWNCRDRNKSIFQMNPFSNMWLISATMIVVLLQIAAVYVPILQYFLHTVPLNFNDWVTATLVGSSVIWVEEVRKAIKKLRF